jgi:S-adenosyl methyltransferase
MGGEHHVDRPEWAPEGVEIDKPSAARVYDYMLGGSHNFAVDRAAAHRIMELMPDAAEQAQANRAFLHRAVRYLVDVGVRQFLDIGSGVPTVGNVHEIAQKSAPDSRVVYVDIDPVAVIQSRHILAGNELATSIEADMRQPSSILGHPQVRELLDFDQPVAVLMLAMLHAIPDEDDPYGVVGVVRDALAPGSYLALTHACPERRPEMWEELRRQWAEQNASYRFTLRSRADLERFFAGTELVEPGLVWLSEWHPEHPDDVDDDPALSGALAGVGRKP